MKKKLELSGKEKSYLRGLGHHLKAILQIGKEGISEAFIGNLQRELTHHELVKVKILDNSPGDKKVFSAPLEKEAGVRVVGTIGKTLLLYKPFDEEPQIELPKSKKKNP